MFSLLYLSIHTVSKFHYPKSTFLNLWFATQNWVAKVMYRFKKALICVMILWLMCLSLFHEIIKTSHPLYGLCFFFILPVSLFLTLVVARQHNWLKLGSDSKWLRNTALNINVICRMGNLTELHFSSSKWYLVPLACGGDYHLTAGVSVATPQPCGKWLYLCCLSRTAF